LKAAVTQSLHRNEQAAAEVNHIGAKRLQFLVKVMEQGHWNKEQIKEKCFLLPGVLLMGGLSYLS